MKVYLYLNLVTIALLIFYGAFQLAQGHNQEDYVPFFALALASLVFTVIVKLYMDFRKGKDSKAVK
jgi:hypothetical protein